MWGVAAPQAPWLEVYQFEIILIDIDFEELFLWHFRSLLATSWGTARMAKLIIVLAAGVILARVGALAATPALAADALVIEVVLQNNSFMPSEVTATANTLIVLKFINKDPVPAEIESKELNVEKVVAGKSEIIVRVKPLKPGKYLLVNDYKADVMQAHLVVK